MDQVLLDKLLNDLKGIGHVLPDGIKINSVKGAYDFIVDAIHQVELIKTDVGVILSGKDKKEMVISVVDRFVHIHWVPVWLLNDLLSWGIDLVIAFLNKKFGNNWITKVSGN